jgi:cytochrome P450
MAASITGDTCLDEEIVAPATYGTPERCDALFTSLRRSDPIHWTSPKDYRPFWAISKYADILEVESKSDLFRNEPRMLLRTLKDEAKTRQLTGGSSVLLRNLTNMDAPDHQVYRRLTQAWFMPARIRTLEDDLRALARESIDHMLGLGGKCDFVSDVAALYPLRAIMRILGIPRADETTMLKLTQEIFGSEDPDIKRQRANVNVAETVKEFFAYFGRLTAERRRNPSDDVATIIANAEIAGKPIGDHEALSYYIIIATAGHDTTSSTIAGGLLALLQNPGEMWSLRAAPEHLSGAVDEMFRWVTPVKHFFRTATSEYTLRGMSIQAGDALMMCYPSANRDEDVFEDPFRFTIARSPNRHLAFGYGPHVCLGQHLAKMEIRIFFEELLRRTAQIDLAGPPAWVQSNFVSGLKSLPIRFCAA